MNSVLKLRVCHFGYFTLVTEGALIIFFSRKKWQGELIGAGALNGANTVMVIFNMELWDSNFSIFIYCYVDCCFCKGITDRFTCLIFDRV